MMQFLPISPQTDLHVIQTIAKQGFSSTPDAVLGQWFSFTEMEKNIEQGRGACIKAVDDNGTVVGMTYAQQENPINGKEGLEKWVIVITAVLPSVVGKGVGTGLLKAIEEYAKHHSATKMFVYTNKDDEKVIHFYKKNGYENAGWIKDYQYGKDNSAIFLLKYL